MILWKISTSLNTHQNKPHPHPQLSLPTAAHNSSKTMLPQHYGSVSRLVPGRKKTKEKKKNICFVLIDLKAGFKRILLSNKDPSVTPTAGKQHKCRRKGVRRGGRRSSRGEEPDSWRGFVGDPTAPGCSAQGRVWLVQAAARPRQGCTAASSPAGDWRRGFCGG